MKIYNMWIKGNWQGRILGSRYDWFPFGIWIALRIYKFVIFEIVLDLQEKHFELTLFNIEFRFYKAPVDMKKQTLKMKYKMKLQITNSSQNFLFILTTAMAWHFFELMWDEERIEIQIIGIRIVLIEFQ